ncbi:MAG: nitrilase family protein [Bacteroidales bacterium]|jgi:predicted amidohydrolase|nr:nitrilase family protein [Bacteroidales bacterium]
MKIALLQSDTVNADIDAAMSHYRQLISHLEPATDLLILPEMFLTGFTTNIGLAQTGIQGLELMKDVARKHNTAVCGSLLTEDNGRYYNRNFFVYPDLSVVHYDKKHLFSLSEEPQVLTAGTTKQTLTYKGWKIRLATCYDLRFGSWTQNTAHDGVLDYDLLIYVASWADVRLQAWDLLLPSRAIENQAFVAAVNRCGTDSQGFTYKGHSVVLGFKGEVLASANDNAEELIYCLLDRDKLLHFRNAFPVWRDWA